MTRLEQLRNDVDKAKKQRDCLNSKLYRAEQVCAHLKTELYYATAWANVKHEWKIAALALPDDVAAEVHNCTLSDCDHNAILEKHGMLDNDKQPTALYNASLFIRMYGRKWCMDLME